MSKKDDIILFNNDYKEIILLLEDTKATKDRINTIKDSVNKELLNIEKELFNN